MATNSRNFNFVQNLIPIFEGESYDYWSLQMRTLFISQDLWELVEEGYEEPESEAAFVTWTNERKQELKDNKKKDAKALLFIQQAVNKAIFPKISPATKSKVAWDILKLEYQGLEKVISIKLQSLWRDFDNLQMKENESVQNFSSRVSGIFNQIRGYGDTIQDKRIVEKNLRCLPAKFDSIVTAIEESKNLSTLQIPKLMGSLEAHEKRINRHSQEPLEQAFQSKLNMSENKALKAE